MRQESRTQGIMLLELVLVMAIIAALLSIAVPGFVAYMEKARAAACGANRYNIEQAERLSYVKNDAPFLVIDNRYKCPSGGVYAWLVTDPNDPNYPRVGCSLHLASVSAPLTSLGSTFTEITTAMISLINNFYQQKNRYPRSFGDYVFTDLGLKPADWTEPVNGIYYSPGGNKVTIRPADGYNLTMKSLQGDALTLTPKLHWNLIYDMLTSQWYYHTITPKNAVDIKTLRVIKN